MLMGQQRGAIGRDIAEENTEAEAGEKQAAGQKDIAQANAANANDPLTKALLEKGYTLNTDPTTGAPTLQDVPGFQRDKPEPQYDKAGNLVGFQTGTGLMSVNDPALPQNLRAFADAAKPKITPVGDASAEQYNASILRELNVNPKTAQKEVPPEYRVLTTDSDAQAKEKLQRAKDLVSGATSQQHITVDTGKTNTNRSDKSYQLQSARLDKLRTPVDQLATRFSRLQDTLDQKSPQADALVGPELLSVMSGGQGSGLRMNEAEISRIVGGRSAWESLKASINHWNTNPEDARSITPDQDKQIRSLIAAVHDKITQKQSILQQAEESLLDSDDPKEHRRIIAEAENQLNAIDAASQQNQGGELKPPKEADPGMKWQHRETNGQVQWRQVPQ
jgi:hypothetical protein